MHFLIINSSFMKPKKTATKKQADKLSFLSTYLNLFLFLKNFLRNQFFNFNHPSLLQQKYYIIFQQACQYFLAIFLLNFKQPQVFSILLHKAIKATLLHVAFTLTFKVKWVFRLGRQHWPCLTLLYNPPQQIPFSQGTSNYSPYKESIY